MYIPERRQESVKAVTHKPAVTAGTCVSVLNTLTAADIDAGSCVQTHARDGSVSVIHK